VNRRSVNAYYTDLSGTANDLGLHSRRNELLRIALQMPNAYNNETVDDSSKENDWTQIKVAILEAIRKCSVFREQEGRMTSDKFVELH
jgi:hypothetical protein